MQFFRICSTSRAITLGILLAGSALPGGLMAQESGNDRGWSLRPYVGLSQLSDQSASVSGTGFANGAADIELDSGFVSGLGVSYRYNANLSAEIAWEYRSNDSQVTLADGTRFDDGNYASNVFAINGIYDFASGGAWTPYLGGGLSWIQEIDIDLEGNGPERSFSGDGDFGYQVFAGLRYLLSDNWNLHGELRYTTFDDLDLDGERIQGRFTGLEYRPLTFQVGLSYSF